MTRQNISLVSSDPFTTLHDDPFTRPLHLHKGAGGEVLSDP